MPAVGEDRQPAVAVQVDEARGDDLAGRIDFMADRGRRLIGRRQDPDAPVRDLDRAGPTRRGLALGLNEAAGYLELRARPPRLRSRRTLCEDT
jgi:hypothetical protein